MSPTDPGPDGALRVTHVWTPAHVVRAIVGVLVPVGFAALLAVDVATIDRASELLDSVGAFLVSVVVFGGYAVCVVVRRTVRRRVVLELDARGVRRYPAWPGGRAALWDLAWEQVSAVEVRRNGWPLLGARPRTELVFGTDRDRIEHSLPALGLSVSPEGLAAYGRRFRPDLSFVDGRHAGGRRPGGLI